MVNTSSQKLESLEFGMAAPYKEGERPSRAEIPLTLCVTFHPDGNQVMTGGADSAVTVWDPRKGHMLDKLRSHSAWIWSIQFTSDGRYMFTGSSDRSMKIWRHEGNGNWEAFATIGGHSHRVSMISMETRSEEKLVTSSLDRSLKVWNVNALKQGLVPAVGGLHYNCLVISPTRKFLVTSQGWGRACAFMSTDTGSRCGSSPGHHGFIRKAVFSSDGKRLFVLDHGHTGGYETGAAANASVKVCSVPDGGSLSDGLDVHAPTCLAVSNKYIITGTMNGQLKLFDVDELSELYQWTWKEETISTVAISSKNDIVVASSGKECQLRIVRDTVGEKTVELPACESDIFNTEFTPDGARLAVGEDSGTINIWDVSGTNVPDGNVPLFATFTAHTAYIKDIKFSPGGAYMVTSADLSMRVWDMKSMTLKCAYYSPVNCAAFYEENLVIAGEATGNKKYLRF